MTKPLVLCLLAGLVAGPAMAQQVRVLEDDAWCRDSRATWYEDDDGERYCEVRELTLPADRDPIAVDGRRNGGISVEGWDRDEILVRAKVTAHAPTEEAARDFARRVELQTGRAIYADVPEGRRKTWASVSFELFVPRRSNLSLETHNGGIRIASVEGEIGFDALNGGVHLVDLAGHVRGETTNGGLHIELTGPHWRGRGLDVETTNGGVDLYVPDGYSARLQTGTVNGRVETDIPITVQGTLGRRLTTELGSGGQTIRAVTTNGGVEIRKAREGEEAEGKRGSG